MLTSSASSLSKKARPVTGGDPTAQGSQVTDRRSQVTDRPRAVALAAEVAFMRGPAVVLTPGRWAIGSGDSNQIVVDHEGVAPRHAMIVVTEHRVLMTSWSNATYVNRERCRESLLCAGDVLTVGTVDITLRAAASTELISQLPDVSADAERPAAVRPVSPDETLRHIDDLDTALGLLQDELGGDEGAVDQLNELIDRIEDDMTQRSERRAEEVDASVSAPVAEDQTADIDPAATSPGSEEESDETAAESFQQMSLDDLLETVEPDEAETHQEQCSETVEDHFFDDLSADFEKDEHQSETEEIAQLVGSTSVLARNLTVNALRSRAEAVRQLDEMILAATDAGTPQHVVESSGNGPVGSSVPAGTGVSGELPVDAEFDAGESDCQAEEPADGWTAEAEEQDDSYTAESQAETPAAGDDWLVDGDVETETAADDTVEFSAIDTVDEAGSLLSSLLRDEPGREEPDAFEVPPSAEQASESVDLPCWETESISPLDDRPDAATVSEVDSAASGVSAATETEQHNERQNVAGIDQVPDETCDAGSDDDVSGVRSRLAEMFDMPSLNSATSPSLDAGGSAAESELHAEDSNAESSNDSFAPDEKADISHSRPHEMNLSSWLDEVKSDSAVVESASVPERVHESVPSKEPVNERAVSGESAESPADSESAPEDSVAAYMKDLLARNRARHGQDVRPEDYVVLPASESSKTSDEAASKEMAEVPSAGEAISSHVPSDVNPQEEVQEQSWLTQEPAHQLVKDRMRAETQTLREVANATARSAVSKATREQLKVQVAVKSTASIVMLGSGVAASVLGISTMFTFLALGVGGYFAFDLGLTIARNWKAIQA